MADYKLTAEQEPCAVIREADGACIPPDMANRDYNGDQFQPGYVQWKEAGGVPDPFVPPPPAPPYVDANARLDAGIGAAIGAAVIFTFGDSGLRIPIGTGNGIGVIVETGTGQVCQSYIVWDE